MKNKILLGALLIGITSIFTACTDDNDANPTLIQPTEFVLNTPAFANNTVDLKNSSILNLSWSQPKYTAENAPINATYEVQVSPTNSFTVSKAQADADETGATVADYTALNRTETHCKYEVTGTELNTALLKLCNWEEDQVPAELDLTVRVASYIAEGSKRLNEVISNPVTIKVKPYYQMLKNADPELWYLIGGCVGDGTWNNGSAANIGVSQIPLSPLSTEKYDATTGQGKLTYTGYFISSQGFKIIKNQVWDDYEWGSADGNSIGSPILKLNNNGAGGGDFKVPADGYYTITLNTATLDLSIAAAENAPAEYASISIIGVNGDWDNDLVMSPVDTWEGAKPHVWKYDITFADDTEMKFRTTGSWDTNWGGTGFPYGWGTNGGANIPVKAGSYTVLFNDITGYYTLISK